MNKLNYMVSSFSGEIKLLLKNLKQYKKKFGAIKAKEKISMISDNISDPMNESIEKLIEFNFKLTDEIRQSM